MVEYSIWVMEYARVKEQPLSVVFNGMHNQGTWEVPFCFGVIKGNDTISLVDIGYDYSGYGRHIADISGCSMWQPIEKILQKINVDVNDVDNVFITHAHFDHIGGNIPKFKNAHFYIQKQEYEKWVWALTLPDYFSWILKAVDPNNIQELGNLLEAKRVTLVDGFIKNVIPLVDLIPALNTHSFGCQYIVINDYNDKAQWAFAGDNIYSYKNLVDDQGKTKYIPIGFCQCDTVNTILSIDKLFGMVGRDPKRLISSHEKDLWGKFPSWVGQDGLYTAEIYLAKNEKSLIKK